MRDFIANVFLLIVIACVLFIVFIVVPEEAERKDALYAECVKVEKYDKFQCYSMIYGG